MLHLYHIPGVRIEASKDHRAIQRSQHAFLRGCNQVDTIMPDIGIIMRRNHSIYRLVEKDTVSRNRIRVQDSQVVFLRLFKILYKLLFLLCLRNLIVRVHSVPANRSLESNRSASSPTEYLPHYSDKEIVSGSSFPTNRHARHSA